MKFLELQVITIERTSYHAEDVASINVPTVSGEITILARHIPLISILKPGVVHITHEDKNGKNNEEFIAIAGGIIEVETNPEKTLVTLLADSAELTHEIDQERVEEARARAIKSLESRAGEMSEEEYKILVTNLANEEARLKALARANHL